MDPSDNDMMTRRIRIVVGSVIAIVMTLFALQSSALIEWLGFRPAGKVHQLRLAAYEGDVGLLEWIAQEQGFYEKVGLQVELKGYSSGKEAAEALTAGQADVATASEFVSTLRSFTEPGLRVLGSIAYYRNKGIVGRRDRGIAAPADLKGKRIGVTSPSGAEYSLYVFLALHGLTEQDVTLANLSPRQIVDALTAGSIDAAITWQPHVQEIEAKLGAGAVSFRGDGFDTYLLLLTREENLPTVNGAAKKLMRAMVMAEEWVRAHPEEAKRYAATRFKLDPAYVESQWAGMQLDVTLSQELLVAMDGAARWLAIKHGKANTAIPNFAHVVHADELKAVKPSAVTLFADLKRPPSAAVTGR